MIRLQGERGSVSVWLVGLSIALIIAIGWAVDGSRKAQAHSEAMSIAEEAARAAGQALRVQALASGQVADVDPQKAVAEAERYLAATGVAGTVVVQGNRIVVDTAVTRSTIFLVIVGVSEFSVRGHGAADLVSDG
ncbi:pilus assembly protein TadG-related protein [Amycolatopsis sp. EV170708-02-1]|uniref:pilus assembly protein TadG-related protein n=1 Tax=Amycolatopsis sp. EV170708-02-1 TaxID=2919322 RepID=UPI001F0CBBC7|nr:pilus assembly protein TadG-related protein [Amycolatopsis sp. EV170708-02-1]UMP06716.1 pilus assembly protein TadG-related protein [Amycolatopsis sp. EV170708-02-1]